MKKILSIVLAGAMLLSFVPVMAADVNITINGEEFIPKNAQGEEVFPFIENGSTFLPVRAMGEAVGKEVSFDMENYAVYIGTKPTEEDIKKMPYAQIGDTIYYEEDVEYIGGLEDMLEAELIKLYAQSIIDEALIKTAHEEQLSMYQDMIEIDDAGEKYLYITACVKLLLENAKLEDEDYLDYVTVKHILVEEKAVAEEIIEKLNDGEEIEELIKEYNIDPGQDKDSSYTFTYGEMVEEFEKAAFELKEGEYTTEIVATDYGYHIIKRLPLNKDEVNEDNIKVRKILEELDKIELEKIVKVEKQGDFGSINSIVIPGKALDNLHVLSGTKNKEENFDFLSYMIRAKNAYEQHKDFFTQEELETAEKDLAEVKEMYGVPGVLFDIEDSETAQYLEDAAVKFVLILTKLFEADEATEETEAIEAALESELEVVAFKQIRVFVDGKLIVPCDVNYSYVEPKNIDGTVFVPVRAIVEALGMKADWDNDRRCVVIEK